MISNKLIGLAALAFLCGSAGFTAVGCSSTTEVTDDDADDDSDAATTSSSSGGKKPVEAGASSSGGEEESCYTNSGALVYSLTTPTLGTGKCSETGFADFLAACTGEGGTEAGCTAFIGSECGKCMLGDEGNTAATPLFIAGAGSILINVNGCYAAVAGADEECIKNASSTGLCIYEGNCKTCDSQADKAGFDACIAEAGATDCKPVSDAATACINAAGEGKDAQLAASCAAEDDDFDAAAAKIVRTFCGTGPTAGGDGGVKVDAGGDAN